MQCPQCGGSLANLDTCSEPEGIRRDVECSKCHTRYMCTKAALFPIDTPLTEERMIERLRGQLSDVNSSLRTLAETFGISAEIDYTTTSVFNNVPVQRITITVARKQRL